MLQAAADHSVFRFEAHGFFEHRNGVVDPDDVPEIAAIMRSESERLQRLVSDLLDDVRIFRSDRRRPFQVPGASDGVYQGMHRSHWWLVAKVR